MVNQETKSVEVNVNEWWTYLLPFIIWIGITYGLLMYLDNFYVAFAFAIGYPFAVLAQGFDVEDQRFDLRFRKYARVACHRVLSLFETRRQLRGRFQNRFAQVGFVCGDFPHLATDEDLAARTEEPLPWWP